MRLRNFTQHPIVLSLGEKTITLPSEGFAKVDSLAGTITETVEVDGVIVPIHNPDVPGKVQGLPDEEEGVLLIVSAIVGAAISGKRMDVLVPGTGPKDGAVRDSKGMIQAVTRLKFP